MVDKDYYKILEVKKTDSIDVIKKSYKKLAMKYHPDKADGDADKKTFEDKFKDINVAYSTLGDAGKRRQYDTGGRGSSFRSQGGAQRGGGFGGFGGFGDIFGGGMEEEDLDLHYRLVIDFMEAIFGVGKEISIKKDVACKKCDGSGSKDGEFSTCGKCNGRGRIEQIVQTPWGAMRQAAKCDDCEGQGKIAKNKCYHCSGSGIVSSREKVRVKIPKGIDNGQTIRVMGGGDASRTGVGDLFLQMAVKPHKVFKRDDVDVYMDFSISFAQAALGDEVSVPTLKDEVKIKIGKGLESGSVLRLRDMGVPHVNSPSYRGDLFVNIVVETPKKLSRAQVKLFKELKKLD